MSGIVAIACSVTLLTACFVWMIGGLARLMAEQTRRHIQIIDCDKAISQLRAETDARRKNTELLEQLSVEFEASLNALRCNTSEPTLN